MRNVNERPGIPALLNAMHCVGFLNVQNFLCMRAVDQREAQVR